MSDYDVRFSAINDALWLIQHGPHDPTPPVLEQPTVSTGARGLQTPMWTSYAREVPSGNGSDPRYAEVSLALDIARFLLNEERAEHSEAGT